LTDHTFWNLAGPGSSSILDHNLTMAADRYLPTREGLIPTGEIASVAGTALDFRTEKRVGEQINEIAEPWFSGGYDHCLIFVDKPKGAMAFAAKLVDPASGRTMTIETTEPAIQFYSGNFLDGTIVSASGNTYPKQSLLCLETQHYPDTPHQSSFPSTLLEPGETYRHITIHTFGIE
jgi:aldose 1-epimerase